MRPVGAQVQGRAPLAVRRHEAGVLEDREVLRHRAGGDAQPGGQPARGLRRAQPGQDRGPGAGQPRVELRGDASGARRLEAEVARGLERRQNVQSGSVHVR